MEENQSVTNNLGNVSKDILWYLNNYILLKDYYDRTISRIAARCIRTGNIAMEEYPFYGYILDVLEEITDTGDFILQHKELYPYVDKKIPGGLNEFKKNLKEYRNELKSNASPDMIKEDEKEIEKMKQMLGVVDKSDDPTAGAGMNMDELMDKLLKQEEATQVEIKAAADFASRQATPAVQIAVPTVAQPTIKQPAQPLAPVSEMKKIIKIKRSMSPESAQAIPPKDSVTE